MRLDTGRVLAGSKVVTNSVIPPEQSPVQLNLWTVACACVKVTVTPKNWNCNDETAVSGSWTRTACIHGITPAHKNDATQCNGNRTENNKQ